MSDKASAPRDEEQGVVAVAKLKPGEAWKSKEVHNIPHNNMKIVFPGILLAIFLAAIDATITAVALPTIVKDIGGQSGYSWVGTAYLLASACMYPFYGKASDIFGRKIVFCGCLFVFLLGSALCGAAQSITWLILARGVQGAGGGGLVGISMITISDITPMQSRTFYLGTVGSMWGVGSVVGPIVGGVLTDRATWRWCFWINLPLGFVCGVIYIFFVHLNPTPRKSAREIAADFDFIGLFLLIAGIACLLVGFNNGAQAQNGWSHKSTIALVVAGGALLILACTNEFLTPRSAIIPPRIFRTRTTAGILVSVFLHAVVFFAANFYLPLYFQVLGANALSAGVKTLAYSTVCFSISAVSSFVMRKTGYQAILWAAWIIAIIGFGLMTRLDERSTKAEQELFILIAGFGLGGLFQVPLIALQAAMPLNDMATSTSAYNMLRTIGAAMGISIGGAIYSSDVHKRLLHIPGYDVSQHPIADISQLASIQPESVRIAVLHAYSKSISLIWIVMLPLCFVGFLCVAFVRKYSLMRATTTNSPQPANAASEDIDDAEARNGYDSENPHESVSHSEKEKLEDEMEISVPS